VEISSREEFEVQVHKCFGRIFELLSAIDSKVTEGAEKEIENGSAGVMSEMRDRLEEVLLQCRLAWQYHRLSRAMGSANTWDRVDRSKDPESPDSRQEESNPSS
jgi:hypothetical protein